MIRTLRKPHALIWGAAAVLIAAACLLVFARSSHAADAGATAPTTPVIDTGAAVSDSSQCAPCHLDIGTVKKPGLIFNHGNHLMVSCDGCHSRMPHQEGATDSVPMDTCFACHGVRHGPQGPLATADCRKCHTASFNLVPANHEPQKDFSGKPHADLSQRTGINRCMMCHQASKDCNPCHVQQKVNIAELPDAYVTIIGQRPKPASVKIYPSGPTNMAQCQYCHPDLDNIIPGRLIFAHAIHLSRAYKCEACHPKFGHTADGPAKPDMQSCYRCHGLQHQGEGLIATEACDKCHPPGFKLIPDNHTPQFIAGDHKNRASQDSEYCAMCHKTTFCVTCHQGRGTSPNAPKTKVIPASHKQSKWLSQHGKLFLAKQDDCGACHDDASCRVCHKSTMPHPPNWIQNHVPEPGVASTDCNICHTDRSVCQNCHHAGVATADLELKNCIRCHQELAQRPPTSIHSQSFSEHAVHFEVVGSKFNGGAPLKCYDCHTDFSTKPATQQATSNPGHDMRLCYSCHGSLDPVSHEVLAPYTGAALCKRCHSTLNF